MSSAKVWCKNKFSIPRVHTSLKTPPPGDLTPHGELEVQNTVKMELGSRLVWQDPAEHPLPPPNPVILTIGDDQRRRGKSSACFGKGHRG